MRLLKESEKNKRSGLTLRGGELRKVGVGLRGFVYWKRSKDVKTKGVREGR